MADITQDPKGYYTLKYAIVKEIKMASGEIREEEIRPAGHTFQLKRSKGRHLEAVEKIKNEVEQGFFMLARATGLSLEEVRDMDAYDINTLGSQLKDFTMGGPATGEPA